MEEVKFKVERKDVKLVLVFRKKVGPSTYNRQTISNMWPWENNELVLENVVPIKGHDDACMDQWARKLGNF